MSRVRKDGFQGSSGIIGVIIDLTEIFSMIFSYAFLIAYALDTSFWHAITLYALTMVISFIYNLLTRPIYRDSLTGWIIGTIAIYPPLFFLFS